jgi:hypothetical protein
MAYGVELPIRVASTNVISSLLLSWLLALFTTTNGVLVRIANSRAFWEALFKAAKAFRASGSRASEIGFGFLIIIFQSSLIG